MRLLCEASLLAEQATVHALSGAQKVHSCAGIPAAWNRNMRQEASEAGESDTWP